MTQEPQEESESEVTSGPYSITEEILRERLARSSRGKSSTQIYACIVGEYSILILPSDLPQGMSEWN